MGKLKMETQWPRNFPAAKAVKVKKADPAAALEKPFAG